MNYYKLNHGTYPGTTHVYFNCTGEDVIKHYSKIKSKTILDEDSKKFLIDKQFGGCTVHNNQTCIVFIPKFNNHSLYYSILQHELLHCTFFILNHVGVLYDIDNNEPFTYFLEYLTKQLYSKTFKEKYPD